MLNTVSRSWAGGERWLTLVFILAAFAARLYGLDAQSLWVDEAISVQLAQRPPAEIVDTLIRQDIHPPLHYLALHYWQALTGNSEFAARYLSLLFSVCVVPLLMVLGRRGLGASAALAAGALAAISPFAVAYAQEARMYAMVAAFSMASLVCFDGILRGRRGAWPAYVMATVLALYTQYYAALVVLTQNLYLLGLWLADPRSRSRVMAWRWACAQALVGLAFLPWLPVLLGKMGWWRNAWVTAPSARDAAVQVWQALSTGPAAYAVEVWPALVAAAVMMALGLAAGLASVERRATTVLAVAGLLVPSAVLFGIAQSRGIFSPKYLLPTAALCYLVFGAGLAALGKRFRAGQAVAGVALLWVSAVGLAGYHGDPRFTKDPFREMAALVSQRARASDLVIMDSADAFAYYYDGAAPWAVLPAQYPLDEDRLADDLTGLAAGHGGGLVYLGQWSAQESDPKGYLGFLLETGSRLVETVPFGRQSLRVYRLREAPVFDASPIAAPVPVRFAGGLELTRWAWGGAGTGTPSGEPLWVSLGWRVSDRLPGPVRVSLKLWSPGGHLAAQADRTLWNNARLPAPLWPIGPEVRDGHILRMLPAVPPGKYRLEASVYGEADGKALPVIDPLTGNAAGLTAALGDVAVTRQVAQPAPRDLGMEHAAQIAVCPGVELLGYDGPASPAASGSGAAVTLFWQAGGSGAADCHRKLLLRDQSGLTVAEGAGPVGGAYPTGQWVEGEVVRDWASLALPAGLAPGEYRMYLAAGGLPAQGELPLGDLVVTARQRQYQAPQLAIEQVAVLGGAIRLLGWETSASGEAVRPGATLRVTLVWSADAAVSGSYTVFTHLVGAGGVMAGQQDGIPAGGLAPTSGWLPGEVVQDTHELVVRPNAVPGEYRLAIGMYDRATMQRLPVTDPAGAALGDHVTLAPGSIIVASVE